MIYQQGAYFTIFLRRPLNNVHMFFFSSRHQFYWVQIVRIYIDQQEISQCLYNLWWITLNKDDDITASHKSAALAEQKKESCRSCTWVDLFSTLYYNGNTMPHNWNLQLKGKFNSGIEGALASTLNHNFNWKQLLYKPLFSRTVIFAFLDFCGNSRVVNFAIFLMLSLL